MGRYSSESGATHFEVELASERLRASARMRGKSWRSTSPSLCWLNDPRLGLMPDSDLAEELHVPDGVVTKIRVSKGIPEFVEPDESEPAD